MPLELREEFEAWQQTDEFKGRTPEARAINKRKPLSERLEEWMNVKYQEGMRLEYGEMVSKVDPRDKTTRFSYMFVLPSAMVRKTYTTDEGDALLNPSDAVRVLAARLGVEPVNLKLWNKDRPIAPPRRNQEIVYYDIDYSKAAILAGHQAEEFRSLEIRDVPQVRSREEIASGKEAVYQEGYIRIEEYFGEEPVEEQQVEPVANPEPAPQREDVTETQMTNAKDAADKQEEETTMNLKELTIAELRKLAKNQGLKLRARDTKPQIIHQLLEHAKK